MAHSEKLLDIMALGKCEGHYTRSQFNSFLHYNHSILNRKTLGAGPIFGARAIV